MAATDATLDRAAFELWVRSDGADNLADLDRLRHVLPLVLEECCTATQQLYIQRYFIDRWSVAQIAAMYGVNKSTVSRGIHRGMDRAHKYLRFLSPLFMRSQPARQYLRR
ncbi:hypothetical protein B5G43_03030 [Flavonifractor sp. An92]|uniref:sigma factor-like helix-turn-helix DNA-binding protein n=1 Tax=Flavonifractor sp. An92 TaxID=1965666 RepID=UPI000B38CF97|nr:sigma factor-like helix-turn-helix DNA-binding protein [Flavonifractor sp. An92]OUN08367.1 hypothetical protein B5G43_03030 [Flavonifractor sp. An92]